jgi:hypothetical protein
MLNFVGVGKFEMLNLKRLVEDPSLLTVLIFFITEVQNQTLEVPIKEGKEGLKHK